MKNKRNIIATMTLLFAISGICNIVSVSAFTDTVYIPPSSYAGYYLEYLEQEDTILINDIDSDGGIDVYIMRLWQFNEFKDHGEYYCERMWKDTIHLAGWRIDITDEDDYYIIIVNNALLSGRNVYVDVSIDWYVDIWVPESPDTLTIIIRALITVVVIAGIIIGSILIGFSIRKHKKKKRKTGIQNQEVIKPKTSFCSNCGIECIDITSDYCSKCGSKINR